MRVVGYIRVSTDAQAEKFGVEAQRKLIEGYCDTHDMEIIDWYEDTGVSGVKESRPQLDRLLYGSIGNPPVEAVIVAKSDRMARDIKLYYYYMMLLEKKKMQLISATEEIVNDDSGLGNVYKALMLFVAEQERANISRRTSGGRKEKALMGGYSGGRKAYGYKLVNGRLCENPEEANMVREIFKLREEGKTLRAIADILEKEGYISRSGRSFDSSTIASILKREDLYRGWYSYGGSAKVRGEQDIILK